PCTEAKLCSTPSPTLAEPAVPSLSIAPEIVQRRARHRLPPPSIPSKRMSPGAFICDCSLGLLTRENQLGSTSVLLRVSIPRDPWIPNAQVRAILTSTFGRRKTPPRR